MDSAQVNLTPQYVDREIVRLSKDGIWLADGEEITHEATRRLFARSLQKDDEGYFIAIGRETKRIEIEDTAFFIQGLLGDPDQGYEALLNDETKVSLDPGKLRYRPGRLVCEVMTVIGLEEAKFLRGPYFEMLSRLQEDETGYFLNFAGSRVDLARK